MSQTNPTPTRFHLRRANVYGVPAGEDLPPAADLSETGVPTEAHAESAPDGPLFRDEELEQAHARAETDNLSLVVQPGDAELGQVYVTLQYEGAKGDYAGCMDGMNAYAAGCSAWVAHLMSAMVGDGEFDVDVDAVACPKARDGLDLRGVRVGLEQGAVEAGAYLRRRSEVRGGADASAEADRRWGLEVDVEPEDR